MERKIERRRDSLVGVRKIVLENDQRQKVSEATRIIRDAVMDQVELPQKETVVFFPFRLAKEDDGMIKHILFEKFRKVRVDICFATPTGATIYIDRMGPDDEESLKKF